MWFSIGKPRKEAEERNEIQLINLFGRSTTLVSTALAVVDTSLNTFHFAR